MSNDYPILGAPTISLQQFAGILSAAGSPAAREAAGIYGAFTARGVNPAVALAIAKHESGYGKLGASVGRNNLFGDRYYASAAAFGATKAGGFARFPSYTANAQYQASLLAGSMYGASKSFGTARTFPFRYAPTSDGNSPTNYGNTIVRLLDTWTGGKGAIPAGTLPKPSGVHKADPGAPVRAKAKAGATHAAGPAKLAGLHPLLTTHPKGTAVATGVGGATFLLLVL